MSGNRSTPMSGWERLAAGFAVLWVILIPLSITIGPERLNVQWSDVAALGFLVVVVVSGGWRITQTHKVVWYAAACYVGLLLPSLWHTQHLSGSLLELTKTVYVVSLGLALAQWASRPAEWLILAKTFALAVGLMLILVLGVWVYAMWSGHVPSNVAVAMAVPNIGQVLRVKATLYTPALLANYLTMGLPVLAAYLATQSRWPGRTNWAVLVAGTLATAMTVSHSLAGCLIAAALIASRKTPLERVAQRCLMGLAVGTAMGAMLLTTVSVYQVRATQAAADAPPAASAPHDFLEREGRGEELTVRVRYGWVIYGLLKRFAWEAWQDHPWIGIGLGEFPHVVAQAYQEGRVHAYYANGADPHSTWLGTLAETGLLGLVGLVGLWAVVLRAGTSSAAWREDWRVRASLAGLVGLGVNSLHVDVMHFRFLWVGIALLLSATVTTTPHTATDV